VAFDAIVLAGGASSRMGSGTPDQALDKPTDKPTDKAVLDVGGVRLLDRVLAAVAGAEQTIVVGPRRPTNRPVVFTSEEPPGSGPAAAIVHGLDRITASIVVILAADVPFAATAVPKLIAALTGQAHADAAMLVDESGHRQLLIAAYRVDALRRNAAGHDWLGASVRRLTGGLAVIEVAAAEFEALDCDTPEQLARARESASRRPVG
jgi:molybdopterin-guanine dinucleotide biosynthesis protein A